ncbi:unnamed protein product [Spirodela intermedia]|uniref:Uncharacterized protein n=1 Tax=Spirodela intermedia TaxID=51605 RepID=A0A7I8KL53_SPIIN|nr:unnamed protein product [Spirodela intermedia]
MTILIVYVSDILITGDDTNEIQNLKGIFISQHKYTIDLLHKTGRLACKSIVTPVDINVKLEARGDSPPVNKESFQKPDVAYAVSSLSQFMNDPREIHLQVAYCFLAYLKNTVGQGLLFSRGSDSTVEIYTDVDYAGSVSDKTSTSRYCSFIDGNLVSLRSKKQKVVSRSSAEAEFRAMAQVICEAIWIKILLEDLHLYSQGCIKLYCDDQSSNVIAHNSV